MYLFLQSDNVQTSTVNNLSTNREMALSKDSKYLCHSDEYNSFQMFRSITNWCTNRPTPEIIRNLYMPK